MARSGKLKQKIKFTKNDLAYIPHMFVTLKDGEEYCDLCGYDKVYKIHTMLVAPDDKKSEDANDIASESPEEIKSTIINFSSMNPELISMSICDECETLVHSTEKALITHVEVFHQGVNSISYLALLEKKSHG